MKKLTLWLLVLAVSLSALTLFGCNKPEEAPDESGETTPTEVETPAFFSDYYVSVDGSDENDGSESAPFATIDKAVETVRAIREAGHTDDVTVNILPGEYAFDGVALTEKDSGITFRKTGDGEVILNAAFSIGGEKFAPVTDDALAARFGENAAHIYVCDLAAEGLTADQIGPLYAIGTYSAYNQTPDEYIGQNPSVFYGDTRLTLARYPNATGDIFAESCIDIVEADILDPGATGADGHGGTLRLPDEAAERVSKWQSVDGAWIFGYFQFNWADESTPIASYDAETQSITCLFAPYSPFTENKTGYYIYNVPEELDYPGEYYIDRDAMKLYLYVEGDPADADLSLTVSGASQFGGTASRVTIEGLTLTGAGGTVINLTGDDNLVKDCVIKHCDNHAVNLTGSGNTVYGCECYDLGKGGIYLTGGDTATLTPGHNVAENNYIHDFARVYVTYQYGIFLNGVGNKAIHNEIAYCPHAALTAFGNDELYEWNYIHDVVRDSDDAGAFYAGGMWTADGNVLRTNKFENIGNEYHGPNAIYFDDMLSGWTAESNVILNCKGFAFTIGGGRNNHVTNNVVIEATGLLYYDDRMRSNYLDGKASFVNRDGGMWATLDAWDYKSDVWQERFPITAKMNPDADVDDIDFPINPAYSTFENNIWIKADHINKWDFQVWDSVYQYSTIGYYYTHTDAARVFEPGTYELTKAASRDKKLVYTPVPYEGYGLYPEA